MKLYKPYARKLLSELSIRYDHLLTVLPDLTKPDDYLECGTASDIRMAVEDFKTILAEFKRLR